MSSGFQPVFRETLASHRFACGRRVLVVPAWRDAFEWVCECGARFAATAVSVHASPAGTDPETIATREGDAS